LRGNGAARIGACTLYTAQKTGVTMSVQESDMFKALSTVMDPDLNIDVVKAGMVKNLKIDGGKVASRSS
jgi:metal-sulfur cluster biosynthetic enzyme